MKKIMLVILTALLVSTVEAETYSFDYVSTSDVDYLVINNQSFSDLRVRFCAGTKCDIATVPTGKSVKIKIDIEFEEDYNTVLIPVKFECRDSSGDIVRVTWKMDNNHHDINLTLLPDEGWSF
ncbi:MAG: hypothetical protein HDR56_02585 [Treponema sp.]|nr:hypothetical protein [Treponema sp.]